MNIDKILSDVNDHFNESPIRRYINHEPEIPNENYIASKLKEVDIQLHVIEEKLYNPLKIVLMGEVKSGKSTLLNALVGKEISKTDILEATSCILEVNYSKEEYAEICFYNKESIKSSLDEIINILDKNCRNLEFFKDCNIIKIGMTLENLKKVNIIDTPGVATITEQNKNKTYEYISNSDVVLWIINATHLGQEDIGDEMEKVANVGKPIIGVLNKIDKVNSSIDKLKEYVLFQWGIYIDECLAVSSYKALKGITKNDTNLIEESMYNDLLEYLIQNIEKNCDDIKIDSMVETIKCLICDDSKYHNEYIEILKALDSKKIKYDEELRKIEREINSDIKYQLRLFESKLLDNEKNKMIKDKEQVVEYLNEKYIQNLIQDEINKCRENLEKRWKKEIESIYIDMDENLENLNKKSYHTENIISSIVKRDKEELINGLGKGATIGGVSSGIMAVYAATLGPAAAAVTVLEAATVFCPPLLIAGAVTGLAGKWLEKREKEKNKEIEIKNSIEILKNDINKTVIPEIIKVFELYNEQIVESSKSAFQSSIYKGLTYENIKYLRGELDRYMTNYEKILSNISFGKSVDKSIIEHIKNEEIRKRFMQAIDVAEEEIDICSPWISKNVMNETLINDIESALNRGVMIKIRYGINGDSSCSYNKNQRNDKSDIIARDLRSRFNRFGENFKINKVDTHYKVLICDEKFYIEGSFNFLSFVGNYETDKREEGATYGESVDYIKKIRIEYFQF